MAVSTSTTGSRSTAEGGKKKSEESGYIPERQYFPELRLDYYREHIESVYSPAPEGLVYHDAWESSLGGVRVFNVWTDEEANDNFVREVLLPAVAEPLRPGLAPTERERWYVRLGRWWGFLPER